MFYLLYGLSWAIISHTLCSPVESGDPIKVLDAMSLVYSVVDSENSVARDIGVILVIAVVFKILFVAGVIFKTRRVADIK